MFKSDLSDISSHSSCLLVTVYVVYLSYPFLFSLLVSFNIKYLL